MNNESKNIYYARGGSQAGPVSLNELVDLVNKGIVNKDTLVWDGEGDWKAADTLNIFETPLSPPPLPNIAIDNKFVWFISATVILQVVLVANYNLLFTFFGLYTFLPIVATWLFLYFCFDSDFDILEAAGHKAPSFLWILFCSPVYLWKRATIVKNGRFHFWIVLFSAIVSLMVPSLLDISRFETQAFNFSRTKNLFAVNNNKTIESNKNVSERNHSESKQPVPAEVVSNSSSEITNSKPKTEIFSNAEIESVRQFYSKYIKPSSDPIKKQLGDCLVTVINDTPGIIGSDSSGDLLEEFWEAANQKGLVEYLYELDLVQEHKLGSRYTIWFIAKSTAFSGNHGGYMMFARVGNEVKFITDEIQNSVADVWLSDNKVNFYVDTFSEANVYNRYLYVFDGSNLSSAFAREVVHNN